MVFIPNCASIAEREDFVRTADSLLLTREEKLRRVEQGLHAKELQLAERERLIHARELKQEQWKAIGKLIIAPKNQKTAKKQQPAVVKGGTTKASMPAVRMTVGKGLGGVGSRNWRPNFTQSVAAAYAKRKDVAKKGLYIDGGQEGEEPSSKSWKSAVAKKTSVAAPAQKRGGKGITNYEGPRPKQSIPAWSHWTKANYEKLREEVGGKAPLVFKHAATVYRLLPDDEKAKWEEIARLDRERYTSEVEALGFRVRAGRKQQKEED